jgi:hypothetical protein
MELPPVIVAEVPAGVPPVEMLITAVETEIILILQPPLAYIGPVPVAERQGIRETV